MCEGVDQSASKQEPVAAPLADGAYDVFLVDAHADIADPARIQVEAVSYTHLTLPTSDLV